MQIFRLCLIKVIAVVTLWWLPNAFCVIMKRSGCEGNCLGYPNFIQTNKISSIFRCVTECRKYNCCVLKYKKATERCKITASTQMDSPVSFRPRMIVTEHEIASGKPTTASSHYESAVSENIVDGDYGTTFHSHDNGADLKPWVIIDLETTFSVSMVRVLPKNENHASYFRDIQILVGNDVSDGNFSNYTVVATYDGPMPYDNTEFFNFTLNPPLCSRYVALYKYVKHSYPTNLMVVRKVEVMTNYN